MFFKSVHQNTKLYITVIAVGVANLGISKICNILYKLSNRLLYQKYQNYSAYIFCESFERMPVN